jgi:heat-inducible transcriptional repressor
MARKTTSPRQNTDLDARKATILEAVVAEHIDTALPVGSSSVLQNTDIAVSPATVRTEMVTLEREGYLAQPHTSAGRIPTDKGYRYFVDHLEAGVLGPVQQTQVREFFATVRGEVEDVLEQTSLLLSQMTTYTSVIVGSAHTQATVLSAQLVSLDPRHLLLVTVFSDGTVSKHTVVPSEAVSFETCSEASRQLHALLINTTLQQSVQVPVSGNAVSTVVREAVAVLHAQRPRIEGESMYIGGASHVADSYDEVETVRKVLNILEQELLVVSLVQDIIDKGLSVAIGTENGQEPLATSALVVAPVTIDGEKVGAVGLLGPTRMKYKEALAAAESVSREITRHFEGTNE